MKTGTLFARPFRAGSPSRAVGPASLALAVCFASLATAGEVRHYRVDPEQSRIDIRVGTAGLFRFAGHDHGVRVKVAKGEVIGDAQDLAACSVTLEFRMADVRVVSTEGPATDLLKIQEKMVGPGVLDAPRFPDARFRSVRVTGKSPGPARFELEVAGELSLRGITRPVSSQLVVQVDGHRLVAQGKATLKQTDFGIQPVSVAGVVKVKDELSLEIEIVALAGERD